jgi:spermidine/putrescine transport system substrate-binding protein
MEMNLGTLLSTTALLAFAAGAANAEGKLNIYNWTDYTSPDVIAKFEKETGIKVTLDTYDSNETLLAKLQAGATGYDIIIPTHNFVPIFIEEGLVQEVGASALPNYANVDERWRNPAWDPEEKYTAPFHMGSTSVAYRRDLYGKDMTSLGEYFEPAPEVQGRISAFKTPEEMVNLAHLYLGQDFCNEDPAAMQKVQDLLVAQKPHVMAYSSEGMNDRLVNGDVIMTAHWNGYALKGRELGKEQGQDVVYAYPKEGVIGWMDNIMIPTAAENIDNARAFINFMMDPENMGLQSNFTGYGNAITGSDQFMTEELRTAPEINPPAGAKMVFSFACNAESQGLIDRVWTNVLR